MCFACKWIGREETQCETNNFEPRKQQSFKNKLEELGFRYDLPRTKGKQIRSFMGLKLKQESEYFKQLGNLDGFE